MLKYIITYIAITLFGSIFLGTPIAIYSTIIYILGLIIVVLFNKKNLAIITYLKLYSIIFSSGTAFIYASELYRQIKGYEFLANFDAYFYFIPTLQSFIQGSTLIEAIREILSDFNLFSRFQSGYFTYLIPFGFLSNYLNAPLDIAIRFTTLLVGSLSSIIIYKLMIVNNIVTRKSYIYTLVTCIFSILFIFSTQTLRDIHVMLLYLLGIYLTFNPNFTFKTVFQILVVIFISCTLRIETGIFLFVLLPIYILNTFQTSKHKSLVLVLSSFTTAAVLSFIIKNMDAIYNVLSTNSEIYLDSDKGSGLVGQFQKLPVLGDILSILFNAIQPLPFWSRLQPPESVPNPEVYNIMDFPRVFASFFNWIVICFIFFYLIHFKKPSHINNKISKLLKMHLLVGFIYLFIQSAVISQRRLLAYYVIYYIFFFIIYSNMNRANKRNLILFTIISYLFIQFLALIYLV